MLSTAVDGSAVPRRSVAAIEGMTESSPALHLSQAFFGRCGGSIGEPAAACLFGAAVLFIPA
jgi:hypothetical protein